MREIGGICVMGCKVSGAACSLSTDEGERMYALRGRWDECVLVGVVVVCLSDSISESLLHSEWQLQERDVDDLIGAQDGGGPCHWSRHTVPAELPMWWVCCCLVCGHAWWVCCCLGTLVCGHVWWVLLLFEALVYADDSPGRRMGWTGCMQCCLLLNFT
jgi:hypothetical protein